MLVAFCSWSVASGVRQTWRHILNILAVSHRPTIDSFKLLNPPFPPLWNKRNQACDGECSRSVTLKCHTEVSSCSYYSFRLGIEMVVTVSILLLVKKKIPYYLAGMIPDSIWYAHPLRLWTALCFPVRTPCLESMLTAGLFYGCLSPTKAGYVCMRAHTHPHPYVLFFTEKKSTLNKEDNQICCVRLERCFVCFSIREILSSDLFNFFFPQNHIGGRVGGDLSFSLCGDSELCVPT